LPEVKVLKSFYDRELGLTETSGLVLSSEKQQCVLQPMEGCGGRFSCASGSHRSFLCVCSHNEHRSGGIGVTVNDVTARGPSLLRPQASAGDFYHEDVNPVEN
jgi:hypothetical protein